LCRIQSLTELRLGSSAEKADGDSNIFTIRGFESVLGTLETMQKLTALKMQLPHVKEININYKRTHSLLNIGVGERGVQFVV
jgi:hypothetical protein